MATDPGGLQGVALNRQTLRRLGRAIGNFATSEVGGRATAFAALLVAFLLAINGLNVVNSYVGRDFMTAIAQRDGRGFARQALLYLAVFAASTVVAVISRFVEERLGLLWREWLTRRLASFYLDGHIYYRLHVARELANPDQRIADDVRAFTVTTLSLALIFLNSTLTVIAFSGVLWSISRLLFAVAVGYAALGSLFAFLLGRPLIRLNYNQSDLEADFRDQLVHVRENAESIALLRREPQLKERLLKQVNGFAENFKHIIGVNRNLGFFTTGYNYMIQLIPALVVAPLFIHGSVDFGVIPQSSMAFAQLIGAFSLIVNQFAQLSAYAAVVARLNALSDAFDNAAKQGPGDVALVDGNDQLAFEKLTLLAPQDGRPLVRDLSVQIRAGTRLLVVVPDDLVASALVRTVAGLWRTGSGSVIRPPMDEVLLLPERPYLPPGTLRELLTAGPDAAQTTDDRIWEALKRVGADGVVHRVGGLDVEHPWDDLLSADEQRVLGVAHMLLATPRFAVLADPVAGLGAARTTHILAALAERGVGCLVLGDGALGRDLFDAVIDIAADGTWTRVTSKDVTR